MQTCNLHKLHLNSILEQSFLSMTTKCYSTMYIKKSVFYRSIFLMNIHFTISHQYSRIWSLIAIKEESIKAMAFSLNINSFKKRSWESYTKPLYALIPLKIQKTYPQYLGQGAVQHLKRHTWPKPRETAWKPAMKFT